MNNNSSIDHLFRHQYGKMVSVLTRIFGLQHLESIEDAVQDTFIRAMKAWQHKMPDNPEAWLMAAAKNRMIDLFRKLTADQQRITKLTSGPAAMTLDDLFLDHEIADAQLRMIFTACHPDLQAQDQIAFALKTISGFGQKEIATALLVKPETIKKRLSRARKLIATKEMKFAIPQGKALPPRLNRVLETLYLLFNEGFHSNNENAVTQKELCGEAMRLTKILLTNELTRSPATYALMALMCFHAARLDSKTGPAKELIDLKNQDRSKWHMPLIMLGDQMMIKAVEKEGFSSYHFEAAIAAEHIRAKSFEDTNWNSILHWYDQLHLLHPSPFLLLNMAVIHIQLSQPKAAKELLDKIQPNALEQRAYLYYGTWAEYSRLMNQPNQAIDYLNQAIDLAKNQEEIAYLIKKKAEINLD